MIIMIMISSSDDIPTHIVSSLALAVAVERMIMENWMIII